VQVALKMIGVRIMRILKKQNLYAFFVGLAALGFADAAFHTARALEWGPDTHEIFQGDFNNDGINDIYLRARPQNENIPIPYDINVNLDVVTGIRDVVLQANGDGTYITIYDPPSAQVQGIAWTASDHTLVFDDFNNDGQQDVLIRANNAGDSHIVLFSFNAKYNA